MAGPDLNHAHNCLGKQAYANQRLANSAVASINDSQGGRKVKSYKCNNCGLYHYGHSNRRKRIAPYNRKKSF